VTFHGWARFGKVVIVAMLLLVFPCLVTLISPIFVTDDAQFGHSFPRRSDPKTISLA
jgi:hypothetical protein